jgi:23S rRNA (uracil1939-C5)-methyltransferase
MGRLSTSFETQTYRPERFVAGGDCLGHQADGRIVFIRGGIPGDVVRVKPAEQSRDWSRVVVDEVVSPSPDRVEPPCPQRRSGCGGCDWQHLRPGAQLPSKVEIVRDAMRRTAKLPDAVVRSGRSVRSEGYRTTVRVVGDDAGRASYRKERSHETVGAAPCLIAHSLLQTILESAQITPGLEVTFRVSDATGEATASWNPAAGEVSDLPDMVRTGPNAYLEEVVAGKTFRVSSRSFFQSGPQAGDLLVKTVQDMIPELVDAGIVMDAYSGVGLFALAATSNQSRLIVIESSKWAVADARVNLSKRVTHIEKEDVGRWQYTRGRPVDVVIADPSRTGLGRKGVAALASTKTPVMALVSCDPVTLARDASLLSEAGYSHDLTEVLDLFPHTHHVECVTRFIRV